jgi:sugar lactone lactonase YvrE
VQVSVNGGSFEDVNLLDGYGIHLGPGINSIIVRVRSQDGTTQRDYSFTTAGGVPEYTVTPGLEGVGGIALPAEPQTVESNSTAAFEVFPERGFLRRESVGGTAPAGSWSNNVWTTGPIAGDCGVAFGFEGGGVIALDTQALSFASTYRDVTNPPAQTVSMSNTGIGTFHWSNQVAYSKGAEGWLSMLPVSGALPVGESVEFTAAANVAGLNAGTYTATVTVAAADATNAPQRIRIGLTVHKASQTIHFENPGKQIITNVTPLVATADPSGLPVAFASVIGPVKLSSFLSPAAATYTGGGEVTLVAGQGGNSNWYAAASVTQSFWVSSVIWVSEPCARGSYSNELRHGVYAYEVVNAKPVSCWTPDLPAWLTLTNLDLIETLAGNGEIGFGGEGGPATNAALGFPGSVKAAAGGAFYFTDDDNHRVRRVDTNGLVQTVAGNGVAGNSGDGGAATNAALDRPVSVTLDEEGNLYIADFGASVVRRVDTNGTISTVAGTGEAGYGGDGGAAASARLSGPSAVCARGGLLYIADQLNGRVRVVDAGGLIHTVAGSGVAGYGGDGGPATNAALLYPTAVAVAPDGRVLIADRYNNRIRAVSTNGVITTFAGTGDYGFGGDGGAATNALLNYPRGVAVDDLGRVFIADTENARLRLVETNGLIRTIAGTGNYGYSGDGGPALAAMLDAPAGIDVDPTRGIVFADANNQRIRRVRLSAGLLQGVPVETGVFPMTLWATDGVTSNDQAFVLTIDKAPATVTLGSLAHTYDGTVKFPACDTVPTGLTVRLSYNGVTNAPINAGVYAVTGLVDELNWEGSGTGTLTIQKAAQTISFGAIGNQALTNRLGLAATVTPSGYAATFGVASGHAGIAGGTNLSFQRVGPVGIVASRGGDTNYLAATPVTNTFTVYSPPIWSAEPVTNGSCLTPYSYRLVAHDPDSWIVDFGGVFSNLFSLQTNAEARVVHPVAGTGAGTFDGEGAFATNHAVYRPSNVNLASNGCLTVADQYNHRIRRIARDGYIETVAGSGAPGFGGDGGPATNAQLRFPADGVQDAAGNLYIADRDNHRIRKVDPDGTIHTLAGTGVPGFGGDNGPAGSAALNFPAGLALDEAGAYLYIADRDNHRIRRLSLSSLVITTVAGTGLPGDAGEGGAATSGRLRNPTDIVLDGAGNLYIADQNNHKVRWVNTNGIMASLAGTGVFGFSGDGGPATNAMLNKPYGVALDGVGRLYISDTDNHRIRQMDLSRGVIRTLAGTGVAGYNGDGILAANAQLNAPYGMAADPLGHLFVADNNNQRVRRLDNGSVYLTGSFADSGSYPVELGARDNDHYVTWQSFTVEVPNIGGIGLATNALAFSATYAGTNPADQSVTLTNVGVTGFAYSNGIAYGAGASNWLTALPATGLLAKAGSVPLTFSVAVTNLNAGTHTATNYVMGEDATNAPQVVVVTLTVAKGVQTIDFPAIADQLITNRVALAATASSGLPVSFAVQSGPAALADLSNLTFTAGGTVTIEASQAGDSNWSGVSNVTRSFTVWPVLTMVVDPAGTGDTTPAPGDYRVTANVATAIQASARAGYHFTGWTQAGGGVVAAAGVESTTATLESNSLVTATFALNVITALTDRAEVTVPEGGTASFRVKLSASGTGDVVVTVARASGDSSLAVSYGASLTFTTANWADYQTVTLAAAEDNGDNVDGLATFTATAAGGGSSVAATEADDDYTLTVTATNGTVAIGSGVKREILQPLYDHGAVVTLTATPNESFHFSEWFVDATGTNNPLALTMDGDKAVTAWFVPVPPKALPPRTIAKKNFTARWQWVEGGAPEGELSVATDAGFVNPVPGYESLYVCNDTECSVNNLVANQDYWYRVRRLTAWSGASDWSKAMKVRTGTGMPVFTSLVQDAPASSGSCQEFALTNLVAGSALLTVNSFDTNNVNVVLTTNALFLHYRWKGTGATARIALSAKHPGTGYKASYEAVLSKPAGRVEVVDVGALTNAGKRLAQEVTLENQTGVLLFGVRLRVDKLDNPNWVVNRSGISPHAEQQAILEYPCVWPAGSQLVVRVVFHADYMKQLRHQPAEYWAGAILPPVNGAEPITTALPIVRSAAYEDASLWLLDLPVIGNRWYAVLQSDDAGARWSTNAPAVRATANYLQWLELEAATNRLYRIQDAGM